MLNVFAAFPRKQQRCSSAAANDHVVKLSRQLLQSIPGIDLVVDMADVTRKKLADYMYASIASLQKVTYGHVQHGM